MDPAPSVGLESSVTSAAPLVPAEETAGAPSRTGGLGISSGFSRLRSLLSDVLVTFKESGLRGVLRKYGWKILAVFFVYYLIRDSILYLLVPYLLAKHLL